MTPGERPGADLLDRPAAGGPVLPGLSRALLACLALQSAAAALAAWSVFRVAAAAALLVAARPSGLPPPLAVPALDLATGTALAGPPLALTGRSPGARLVVLEIDGVPRLAAAVRGGRFDLLDLTLPPGPRALVVLAIAADGRTAASRPVVAIVPPAPPPALAPQPARPSPLPHPPLAALPVRPPLPPSVARLPRNLLRGPDRPAIALTFDGGAEAEHAGEVLEALRTRGVRCTLFLTGEFVVSYPALARAIVADGHEVGNHTFRHPHLADWVAGRGHVTRRDMTRPRLLAELDDTRAVFVHTTGAEMSDWWRAPYGEVNDEILRWAAEAGWRHVGWTQGLDTLDWVADPSDRRYRSAREIRDRLLAAARAGEPARGGIVLMHLGVDRDGDRPAGELPGIIDGLRREGYRLVTISSLLGS